jgi:hypothetical protein
MSEMAAASLILGLLSLIPFFCLMPCSGVPAIILGVVALVSIRRGGGLHTGKRLAWAGIALGAFVTAFALYCQITANLEMHVRVNAIGARGNLQSLVSVIEAYEVDHNAWPERLDQLTSPVAYIASIPLDPFAKDDGRGPETRWPSYTLLPPEPGRGQSSRRRWVLLSRGPDGVFSIDPARDLPIGMQRDRSELESPLQFKAYDPTNGTFSSGDIFRSSEGYTR